MAISHTVEAAGKRRTTSATVFLDMRCSEKERKLATRWIVEWAICSCDVNDHESYAHYAGEAHDNNTLDTGECP